MPPVSAFEAYKSLQNGKNKKKIKPKKEKIKAIKNHSTPFKPKGKKKKKNLLTNFEAISEMETEDISQDNISGEDSFKSTEISSTIYDVDLSTHTEKSTNKISTLSNGNGKNEAKKFKKNKTKKNVPYSDSSTDNFEYSTMICEEESIIDLVETKPVANKKSKKFQSKQTVEEDSDDAPHQRDVNSNVAVSNSIVEGEKSFLWLISPLTVERFFSNYWEQNALLLTRSNAEYYQQLISFGAIDDMLLRNHVEFTKNLDVTSYEKGVRETHNPEGRALPSAVWDFYNDGCSVRLLNPQTFIKPLYELCATMQEYFHCLVGVNAYLTPANSQGFAPHYDDIEAFVLQIEGRKRWKLYKPRTQAEVLPRFSSQNFSQQEIGDPVFDEVLKPGDLLYFPRGTIHQASTAPGFHSLHITLSVYQKQSYADLLEKMLPIILDKAISKNENLRRGLPLNVWRNAGLAFNETDTQERAQLERKVTKLIGECLRSVQLTDVMDAAVDELAKKYQHEALPPNISAAEEKHTVFGVQNSFDKCGEPNCPIALRSNIRLLRANILRLVSEENQIRIYYHLDNSKEYCQYEPNFFEIEPELAGSVEVLIKSYPAYVSVSQLPLEDDESKIDLAVCMWKRGLLMTEKPVQNC